MIIEFLLIAVIMVFIVDYSGVISDIESFFSKSLKVKGFHIPKPFSCGLCMTFWGCIVYSILKSDFTVMNVFLSCMAAYSTYIIYDVLVAFRERIEKIIDKI